MATKKLQLKKALKKLNISVIGNYVKKSEVKKALALAADIEKAYKTNENDEWTVFKLPCEDGSTKGVNAFDAFHYFCDGTRWVRTDEFWGQLKDAGKTLLIFVSKTKDKANPLWKIATDELEHTYLDAHDNQVKDISNLQLPPVNYVPPAATERCTCDIYELMRNGCKCGGYEKEKSQKSLTSELHKLGIKTYRKKSTNKVFVKRKDVRSAFAAHTTKAAWRHPDAEDLYDYANNVEFLYNELQRLGRRPHAIKEVAELIIEEYNESCKDNPESLYKGSAEDLVEVIKENEELD